MKNLTLSTKMWLFSCACAAIVLWFVYVFISEEWVDFKSKSSQLEAGIEQKKMELHKIMAQNQRKGELQLEIQNASEDFEKLKEMFPDKDIIPLRLQDLNQAAKKTGVTPTSFIPASVIQKEFYQENNYSIKVKANYHGLGLFFQEISNFRYPTSLEKVKILKSPQLLFPINDEDYENITNTVSAEFQLTTYTSKNEK